MEAVLLWEVSSEMEISSYGGSLNTGRVHLVGGGGGELNSWQASAREGLAVSRCQYHSTL